MSNFSKRDSFEVLFEAMITGDTGSAIENQEKCRQGDLIRNEVLPKQCPRLDLETLGFVFGEDADDLFVQVKFPAGWKKVATSHSMWSDLIDPQGRQRGNIFYKAAFYDRSAHMSLTRRFFAGLQPINGYGDNYNPDDPAVGKVVDCGKVIWQSERQAPSVYTEAYDSALSRELETEAMDWLNEHYPDHLNPLAYWD